MKSSLLLLKIIAPIFLLIMAANLLSGNKLTKVVLGADELFSKENINLVLDNGIGVVTNQTGRLSNGASLIDTLINLPNVTVNAIFTPEHGFLGNAPNGEEISNSVYGNSKIPVYSLYGKTREPSEAMLKNIDVLIFDIQDIGARYYTYISTLHHVLNAAAKFNKKIIVLDRPNPIGGISVEGRIGENSYRSFVNTAPIAIRHGMTIGELALLFNGENWLDCGKKADLKVIKVSGWKRGLYYDETTLTWTNPSPNMISVEAATLYPGLCLIEGTNISEGRGTNYPFIQIGSPFISSLELINQLDKAKITGIEYIPVQFTPKSIEGKSTNPKYKNVFCNGVKFRITDRTKFNSVKFGIALLYSLKKLYSDKIVFGKWLDKLYGSASLRESLESGASLASILSADSTGMKQFLKLRKKYLIY